MNNEDEEDDLLPGKATAINAAAISDQQAPRPMLINPKANIFFRKAKATEDIVIQNQDVNVSFWWYDEGGVAAPTEKCEGYVILTP